MKTCYLTPVPGSYGGQVCCSRPLAISKLPLLLEHRTANTALTYHKHVTLGAILLHHIPWLSQAADLSSLAQSVQEPTYEIVFQKAHFSSHKREVMDC